MQQILYESIWFSDHTKFKHSMVQDWYNKGLRFIYDLFNESTGKLHTKETLEATFNIKMTFMCHVSLIRSLHESVRPASVAKITGPILPLRINIVLNYTNFPRLTYNTYIQRIESYITTRYQMYLDIKVNTWCFLTNPSEIRALVFALAKMSFTRHALKNLFQL